MKEVEQNVAEVWERKRMRFYFLYGGVAVIATVAMWMTMLVGMHHLLTRSDECAAEACVLQRSAQKDGAVR